MPLGLGGGDRSCLRSADWVREGAEKCTLRGAEVVDMVEVVEGLFMVVVDGGYEQYASSESWCAMVMVWG